jgi:hypothetical protein
VKLVQMPTALLHLGDDDLDDVGIDRRLLADFRVRLSRAVEHQQGLLVLVSAEAGGHHLLMVLARRIGVTLRDANIHLRDAGGDIKSGRQKLCYLTGSALASALNAADWRRVLAAEAACFVQDLDEVWRPGECRAGATDWGMLRSLLDERLAAGRPTFVQAAPDQVPRELEALLRRRLPVLESADDLRGGES